VDVADREIAPAACRHASAVTIASVYNLNYAAAAASDLCRTNFYEGFNDCEIFLALNNPIIAGIRISANCKHAWAMYVSCYHGVR